MDKEHKEASATMLAAAEYYEEARATGNNMTQAFAVLQRAFKELSELHEKH